MNKISPACFVETGVRRSVDSDNFEKSFILRLDTICYEICLPEKDHVKAFSFEAVRQSLIDTAVKFIIEAPLFSNEEYQKLMQERYSDMVFKLD